MQVFNSVSFLISTQEYLFGYKSFSLNGLDLLRKVIIYVL